MHYATIIVYFLLPSFYDKDKVRAQLENQILQQSATAMIAQASKSMQTVLELLR